MICPLIDENRTPMLRCGSADRMDEQSVQGFAMIAIYVWPLLATERLPVTVLSARRNPAFNPSYNKRIGVKKPIMTTPRYTALRPAGAGSHRHHWKLQLIEGIILILLGFVAVFVPFGLGISIFVWLFLIGGITGLITTLVMWNAAGFWWSLLSAVLAIGIAILLFAIPELAIVGFLAVVGFPCAGGHCDSHAGVGALASVIGAMGLDARQRDRRSIPGCFHRDRIAGDSPLGFGAHPRRQSDIWWWSDDWNGVGRA
jgi:hypothetical protein